MFPIISEAMENDICGYTESGRNLSNLLDHNATTCQSPFTSTPGSFYSTFRVHFEQPCGPMKLILLTNVPCHDPFTLVAATNVSCDSNDGRCKQLRQCSLYVEVPFMDQLNQCEFICFCIGCCETLKLHQFLLPWQKYEPGTFRLCDINVIN